MQSSQPLCRFRAYRSSLGEQAVILSCKVLTKVVCCLSWIRPPHAGAHSGYFHPIDFSHDVITHKARQSSDGLDGPHFGGCSLWWNSEATFMTHCGPSIQAMDLHVWVHSGCALHGTKTAQSARLSSIAIRSRSPLPPIIPWGRAFHNDLPPGARSLARLPVLYPVRIGGDFNVDWGPENSNYDLTKLGNCYQ